MKGVREVPVIPAPAKITDPKVGDRVLIAGRLLGGEVGRVVEIVGGTYCHVKLEASGETVAAHIDNLYEVPTSQRSVDLLRSSRICREAAERAGDPVVRDAFEEAAQWFYGRIPVEDRAEPLTWLTDGEEDAKPEAPVPVSAIDLRYLIAAGDALATKLSNAPGIDYGRNGFINDWRRAVEKIKR